jgi:hypothetical protein
LGSAPIASDPDRNGNLLIDSWESVFFGGSSVSAFDDSDGDGYSNVQEMLAGSDPENLANFPAAPVANFSVPVLPLNLGASQGALTSQWPASYLGVFKFGLRAISMGDAGFAELPVGTPVDWGGDTFSLTFSLPPWSKSILLPGRSATAVMSRGRAPIPSSREISHWPIQNSLWSDSWIPPAGWVARLAFASVPGLILRHVVDESSLLHPFCRFVTGKSGRGVTRNRRLGRFSRGRWGWGRRRHSPAALLAKIAKRLGQGLLDGDAIETTKAPDGLGRGDFPVNGVT